MWFLCSIQLLKLFAICAIDWMRNGSAFLRFSNFDEKRISVEWLNILLEEPVFYTISLDIVLGVANNFYFFEMFRLLLMVFSFSDEEKIAADTPKKHVANRTENYILSTLFVCKTQVVQNIVHAHLNAMQRCTTISMFIHVDAMK